MILDGRAKFGVSQRTFLIGQSVSGIPADNDLALDAAPAVACVNAYGLTARWIAQCPDCSGAEYVWLEAPRFYCVSCRNVRIGGRWRPVALPDDRDEIEAALLARPDPHTRHWMPPETVADLLAENTRQGVGA